ncbi:hypothetical protein FGU46_07915 [Methanobacterium sp. CWC-01]|jgi:ribosomal protein L37AE/L43A|uniref:hypothetical protein n=1 Tax=Methanobacterium aridiramus TaxID=2584467 RepID=UPI002574DA03|nr:hypothetical protein [Methanobacterium sp. CWC-01]WJI10018.1 hypothetical protein FGU46_07915 [Methanobacterium sp. CWC-01]
MKVVKKVIDLRRHGKYCPRCGSNNIKWLIPQMGSIWDCMDCGYHGAVIIEDEELAVEIRKKFLEKEAEESAW